MTEPFRPMSTDPEEVLADVGRSWLWTLAFGLITTAVGIMMLSWPEVTVRVVAIIIGVQLLVAGVARFVTAFTHDETGGSRVLYVFLSVLAVLAGVLCLRHQLETIGVLALIVGAYWLISGVLTLYVAITNRELPLRGLTVFFGGLGVVAGILVLAYPVQSAVALARLFGLWLVLLGVFEVGMAFALRMAVRRLAAGERRT